MLGNGLALLSHIGRHVFRTVWKDMLLKLRMSISVLGKLWAYNIDWMIVASLVYDKAG